MSGYMRKIFTVLLLAIFIPHSFLSANNCLELGQWESNELYRTGDHCDDAVFNATSKSMVGWGIFLALGIALLAGFMHQSLAPTTTTTSK